MIFLTNFFKLFLFFNFILLLKGYLFIDETKNLYNNYNTLERNKRKIKRSDSEDKEKELIAFLLKGSGYENHLSLLPWDWIDSF
ncbi:Hypothetical protein SRAE_X000169900 [Strongyloides ratti]|uniref:Uncharacterized protein n=1 Tax=Strongyloides ratti TaxID=34506 RepID=A0A090MPC8_STRRB|nr:Hypothetical protein SRAE_X000169900 [Strongyloides ratti]CEF59957.1 Hypothetical protein SRAE_X000169900 [Strongyloides ratti]